MQRHKKIFIVVIFIVITGLFALYLSYKPISFQKVKETETSDNVLPDTIEYIQEYKYSFPYLAKADTFYEQGVFDSSIFQFLKAVNILERIDSLKKYPLLAEVYYYIGINYRLTNNPDSAFIYLNKALISQKKLFGENSFSVAKSYIEIGNVHRWIRFDYYNADKNYEIAVKILEQTDHPEKDEFLFRCNYNLSTVNRMKGDHEKALNYGFYALESINLFSDNELYKEFCFAIIANIYVAMEENEKAINYFKSAIKISKTNKQMYLPLYYDNIGFIYNNLGKYKNAIKYLNKSQKILKDNLQELSNCYEFIGTSYEKLNNFDSAYYYSSSSLNLRKKKFGEKHVKTSYAYSNIGNLYKRFDQIDSALFYYQMAIIAGISSFNDRNIIDNPTFSSIKNKSFLIEIIANKAFALKLKYFKTTNSKYLNSSIHTFSLVDSLILSSRNSFDFEKSKLFLGKNTHKIYEGGIDCSQLFHKKENNLKYIQYALTFFEKNKYQLLLDKLMKAENINKAGIPIDIKEKENNLLIEIQYIKNRLDTEKDNHIIKTLHSKLFLVSKDIEKLNNKLAQDYPRYFQTKYSSQPINISSIQDYSKNNNTKIIQYFYGDSAIYGISCILNSNRFLKINMNDTLRECIKKYSKLLSTNDVTSVTKYKEYIKYSYYLYNQLMKPFLINSTININEKSSKLIVIPDGALSNLPFETLLMNLPIHNELNYKKLDYLINHYQISYAYSSSLLLQNDSDIDRSANSMLAFSYSNNNISSIENQQNNSRSNIKLSELNGASMEIETLKRLFNGKFLTGNESTEYFFKKNAGKFDILHLALHGIADTISGIHTKLIFKQNKDSSEDGYLYPYELYNLDLKAKLTVLSACETGIGEFQKGEGVFSMGRAFAYAGCPSLIMSLWKVNDETTCSLMNNFYTNLNKGESIDNALHQAKIAYLNQADEYTSHPANWASFIASGDMSPVKIITKTKYWSLRISIWLSIAGIIFIFIKKIKNKYR